MTPNDSKSFRPSALFPLLLSILSFALTIVLVLSGTNPTSEPDSFIFSLNTTDVGTKFIQLSPIEALAAAPNTARYVQTMPARSIIADAAPLNSTASNSTLAATSEISSSVSEAPATNITIAETAADPTTPIPVASSSPAVPMLAIPSAVASTNPNVTSITFVGSIFQLLLNTLASAMPQSFQALIQVGLAAQKQSAGVKQIYSFYLTGVCFGSTANATSTNSSSGVEISKCITYPEVGSYILNSTKDSTDYFLVGNTNITIPLLSQVPALGVSGKSFMDKLGFVILTVSIITLIGNGLSILLSLGALAAPGITWIPFTATLLTFPTAFLLQIAAMVSGSIAGGVSSSVNSSTDISGLSATSGSKFVAFIWIAFIAAQATNIYWTNLWLVKYRKTSFKKRERTPAQMLAGYRALGKELMSDFKLKKADEYEDTEALVDSSIEVRHWNDNEKMR